MEALLQYTDEADTIPASNNDNSNGNNIINANNDLKFTENIINKITEQIENVVSEKWLQLSAETTPPPRAVKQRASPTHPNSKHHQNCHDYHKGVQPKAINMEEWAEVYNRLKSFDIEKKERIKLRTEEKQKAEMLEVKIKPTISKASEKMVRNHEDILQRMIARKVESDKKLNQLRKLKEESIMSKVQPQPAINPQSQKIHRPKGVMELWTLERNKRLKALQEKQREAEEELLKKLFKPKINSKSLKLVEKCRDFDEDVAQRLANQHKKSLDKLDIMRKQLEPTHQPTINDRSKSIKLTAPVHERLYNVGMEHIVSKHKFMVDNWGFSYTLKKPLNLGVEPNPPVNVLPIEQKVELYPDDNEHVFYEHDSENAINYKTAVSEHDPIPAHFTNNNFGYDNFDMSIGEGYDEELQQMMAEAGFFKSHHSFVVPDDV